MLSLGIEEIIKAHGRGKNLTDSLMLIPLCPRKMEINLSNLKLFSYQIKIVGRWSMKPRMNPPDPIHLRGYLVLKANYFKHYDVLEAHRGFDPSFTWRSIWNVKSLLEEGMIWFVGNVTNIVVSDVWIKGEDGGHILVPNGLHDMSLRVDDLIDHNISSWNVELVRSLFIEKDCQKIQVIPLLSSPMSDVDIGGPCSRVNILLGRVNLAANRGNEAKVGQQVWSVPRPPKLHHFLWRACKGNLAMRQRLKSKHVTEEATCTLCGNDEETIIHAIFECSNVANIWSHCDEYALINAAPSSSFKDKWEWLSSNSAPYQATRGGHPCLGSFVMSK
ncbi:hypothetical protein RDABS01_016755 [Bienertia sinuspersici]